MAKRKVKTKDDGLVDEWHRSDMFTRLHDCRTMLYVHGLIPDSMNEKLKTRIAQFVAKRKRDKNEEVAGKRA